MPGRPSGRTRGAQQHGIAEQHHQGIAVAKADDLGRQRTASVHDPALRADRHG
jgi:hypothetical protein